MSRGAGRPLSMTSIISASGASVAAGLKRRDDGPSAAYLLSPLGSWLLHMIMNKVSIFQSCKIHMHY